MMDANAKPISSVWKDFQGYAAEIDKCYEKPMAPHDLWVVCDTAKRISFQAKIDAAEVWEKMVFTDAYYRMPKVYAVADARGRVKIGQTEGMESRLAGLQVGNADRLKLLGFVPCLPVIERRIHRYLEKYNVIGEWFKKHKKVYEVVDCLANKDRRTLYGLLEIKYQDPEET